MSKETGFILYRGPSRLDGAPIIVVATMSTRNPKTGNMVQVWVLREDIAPHHAVKSGDDASVCGDCVHRPANQGSCYVTVFQAPLAVWKAYHRGAYSTDMALFYRRIRNRKVRMGAYGDPAAAPTSLWTTIARKAAGHTGYTHQMAHSGFDAALLDVCMASADTQEQAQRYQAAGVRYFRVVRDKAEAIRGEVECLSDSANLSCEECGVCDGSGRGKGKSVYIQAHGAKASSFNPADLIAVG